MTEPAIFEQRRHLVAAMANLSKARSFDEFIGVLRGSGRSITAAEGVTIIRREGDQVIYLAEDAITPLWAGRRFPIEACISGMAITENRPILIPDIYSDARVPHSAYRPTFVRSMAMYPVGQAEPVMAIGAYWREAGPIDQGAAGLLASLARQAGITLGRITARTPASVH